MFKICDFSGGNAYKILPEGTYDPREE